MTIKVTFLSIYVYALSLVVTTARLLHLSQSKMITKFKFTLLFNSNVSGTLSSNALKTFVILNTNIKNKITDFVDNIDISINRKIYLNFFFN